MDNKEIEKEISKHTCSNTSPHHPQNLDEQGGNKERKSRNVTKIINSRQQLLISIYVIMKHSKAARMVYIELNEDLN